VNGTKADETNWPFGDNPDISAGRIDIIGGRVGSGLSGDNILLATVVFKSVGEGTTNIIIRSCPEGQSCFVLDDEAGTILDDDIPPEGIQLATIFPAYPGDVNWDGVIDLADAILALKGLLYIESDNIHINADVNGDDKIGLEEVIFILQGIAEIRE
jgi:hypothetical protein